MSKGLENRRHSQTRARTRTLGVVAGAFLSDEATRLSTATYLRKKSMVGNIVKFFGAAEMFDAISSTRIEQFVQHRRERATANSVRLELGVLRGIFAWAVKRGFIEENPALAIRVSKSDQTERRSLTRVEFERILEACSAWLQVIVRLSVATGLSRSQLLSLRWDQLDKHKSEIRLQSSGRDTCRCIPLNRTARSLLASLRAEQRDSIGAIFNGKSFTKANISQAFMRATRSVGIGDISFKDLRESGAHWILKEGLGLEAVAEFLGHKDVGTAVHYQHLSTPRLKDAVDAIDRFLSSESTENLKTSK